MGEIERARLYPFEKLRSARKVLPADRVAERLQPLFQNTACAGFEITHPHYFFLSDGGFWAD
jgi:hypothetical protein